MIYRQSKPVGFTQSQSCAEWKPALDRLGKPGWLRAVSGKPSACLVVGLRRSINPARAICLTDTLRHQCLSPDEVGPVF